MKTISIAQLHELQGHVQAINAILGLTVSTSYVATRQTHSPSRRISKVAPYFLETPTFKYRYLHTADGNRRLSLLYQYLCKEFRETRSYIAPETTPDEFISLFGGETNNNVVIWTGSKQDLYYFIKRMVERKVIDIPHSSTIWTITQNHFSDRRGNIFLDLRNQHTPKTSAEAIERLIDILDPAATSASELTDLSRKVGATFGGR